MPDCGTFELDDDAIGVVADEAGEMFFSSQPIDERSKADALHDSADPDALAYMSWDRVCPGAGQSDFAPRIQA